MNIKKLILFELKLSLYVDKQKHSNIEYYCAFVTPKVQMLNTFIDDVKKIVALKDDPTLP
ncbi:MAG: hypothetical protein JWP44_3966 [Mucilaginibacter sp.]|nr:hypothetical protein [Mucilaginibacter sp.]